MSTGSALAHYGKVISKIHWKEILKAIATLGPIAGNIYEDFKAGKTESHWVGSTSQVSVSLQEVHSMVAKHEGFINQQAQLNTQLTDQLNILAVASNTLSSRLNVVIWIVAFQMILILILLARLILK
jgi:hypothetical protein